MQPKGVREPLLELREDPRLQLRQRPRVVHAQDLKHGGIGVVPTVVKVEERRGLDVKHGHEPVRVPDLQPAHDEVLLHAGEHLGAAHVDGEVERGGNQLHADAVPGEAPRVDQVAAAELHLVPAAHGAVGAHAILPREALRRNVLLRVAGRAGPADPPVIRGKHLGRTYPDVHIRVVHLRERARVHRRQQRGIQHGRALQVHDHLQIGGIRAATPREPQQQEGRKQPEKMQ